MSIEDAPADVQVINPPLISTEEQEEAATTSTNGEQNPDKPSNPAQDGTDKIPPTAEAEAEPTPTEQAEPIPVPNPKSPNPNPPPTPPSPPPIVETDLAPLPTEFDPDAPIPTIQPIEDASSNPFGVREDDDLNSISSQQPETEEEIEEVEMVETQEPEEEDESKMMEYIASLQQSGVPEEEEEEEEEVEQVENRDNNITKELTVLEEQEDVEGDVIVVQEDKEKDSEHKQNGDEKEKEKDKEGTKDVEMPSRASSPLTPISDIPDLPDTLTFSPPSPANPLPPPPPPPVASKKRKEKPVESNEPSIPHAESSTSARKRSYTSTTSKRTTSIPIRATPIPKLPTKGNKRTRSDEHIKTKGKNITKRRGRPPKIPNPDEIDELEEDDLNSIESNDVDGLREIDLEELDLRNGKNSTEKDNDNDNEIDMDMDISVGKKGSKRLKLIVGKGKSKKGSSKRSDGTTSKKTTDRPSEKTITRGKNYTDAMIRKQSEGKTKEIQLASCLRPRYGDWGKCTQCIAKLGGDSCRFREFRTFPIDPETTEITGPGYFESTEWKEDSTPLPTEFNKEFEEDEIVKTEKIVAPMLLPLITSEARHVYGKKAIKRGMDAAKHRSVCDFCSSTIFGGWFFCKTCGRDYCLSCERYFPDSLETITQSPWPMPDAARPRLLRCQHVGLKEGGGEKQPRGTAMHYRSKLQPVSRFNFNELKEHWLKLSEFVLDDDNRESLENKLSYMFLSKSDENVKNLIEGFEEDSIPTLPNNEEELENILSSEDLYSEVDGNKTKEPVYKYTKSTNPLIKPISDPADLESQSREFLFIDNDNLTNQVFDKIWSNGEPIIVDNVNQSLNLGWTPDDFINRFGDEYCYVVDCQTDVSQPTTVGRFFEKFRDPDNRSKSILKLKDWPATDDFKNTHPELYNDFCDALPVPDYTRREGVMNLYAHFPPGPTKPDIGPKMYNAFEARETTGGFGSTRLHMDVADAVNLLLYASPRRKKKSKSKSETNGLNDNIESNAENSSGDEINNDKDQNKDQNQDKDKDQDTNEENSQGTNQGKNPDKDGNPSPNDQHKDQNKETELSIRPNTEVLINKESESNVEKDNNNQNGIPSTNEDNTQNLPEEEEEEDDEEDEQPGCAVWDLFRAEDADLIREFLKEKFGQSYIFTDPIHSQLFYLDSNLRRELFETKGVRGWRVYQYPGQAVFIPAGCAHQVCNLADCIKIALDFVSPHNIRRCQQLTADFRKENFAKTWKEDVLQLYNVLWYAWLSCIETRKRRIRETEEAASAQKAREAHLESLRKGEHDPEPDHEPWSGSLRHHRARHTRLGSPVQSTSHQGWGGGWVVSSVRDEPHLESRSPSISRGGSPILARSAGEDDQGEKGQTTNEEREKEKEGREKEDQDIEMENINGSEIQKEKAHEGDEEKDKNEDQIKAKKELAEKLLLITLEKEPPSSSETFLGSATLWQNKKGITLPKTKSTSITSSISTSTRNATSSTTTNPPSTSVTLSSRQLSLLAKQKELEEKREKERIERRNKNPPRELRTSTLIKLGAKSFEDVLEMAKGDLISELGEDSEGIIGSNGLVGGEEGEEEIWPNPNPESNPTLDNNESTSILQPEPEPQSELEPELTNYSFLSDINDIRNNQHLDDNNIDSPMTIDLNLDPNVNLEIHNSLRSIHDVFRNESGDEGEEMEMEVEDVNGINDFNDLINHEDDEEEQEEEEQAHVEEDMNINSNEDVHNDNDHEETEEARREREELVDHLRMMGEMGDVEGEGEGEGDHEGTEGLFEL